MAWDEGLSVYGGRNDGNSRGRFNYSGQLSSNREFARGMRLTSHCASLISRWEQA
jgi:hypothetical protein